MNHERTRFRIIESSDSQEQLPNEREALFRISTADKDLNLQFKGDDGEWKTILFIDHYDHMISVCGSLGSRSIIDVNPDKSRLIRKEKSLNSEMIIFEKNNERLLIGLYRIVDDEI